MKKGAFIYLVVSLVFSALSSAGAHPEIESLFPQSFTTEETVREFVDSLVNGGRIETREIGGHTFSIVFYLGSGVPVIGVAAYAQENDHWKRVTVVRPPYGDSYHLQISDTEVFLVGDRTDQKCLLLSLK